MKAGRHIVIFYVKWEKNPLFPLIFRIAISKNPLYNVQSGFWLESRNTAFLGVPI